MTQTALDNTAMAMAEKKARRDAGEGAFITNSNYPFNCYEDEWVLGYQPSKCINVSFLNNFEIDFQMDLRQALATVFTWAASPGIYIGVVNIILQQNEPAFSKKGVDQYVAWVRKNHTSDTALGFAKTVLNALCLIDSAKYSPLYEQMKSVKPRMRSKNFLDIEKGALSSIENEGLALALNDKSRLLFASGNQPTLQEIRKFIALRLTHATARRPVQLAQLKWCDLNSTPHPVEHCFHLTMPMSKQGDAVPFRASFEDVPFPILPELYKELLHYRHCIVTALKAHFLSQNIELTDEEQRQLLLALPLFLNPKIFEAKFESKALIFESISQDSEAFHCEPYAIKDLLKSEFKSLETPSDRVVNLNYSTNRQRHTIGTGLGVKGVDKSVIAKALGHSTSVNVKHYVDMTVDMMRAINASVEGMELLQQAYEGRLVDAVQPADVNIQSYQPGKGLDDVGTGQSSCHLCDRSRPLHCYGCPSFRPLKDGDHRSVYSEALHQYDQHIKQEIAEIALAPLRNAIKHIAITIKACDKALSTPKAIGDTNDATIS